MTTKHDGEHNYRVALEAARQWQDTYKLTDNLRHLEAAMACYSMAFERFARLQADHAPGRRYTELQHIERLAQHEAACAEAQRQLAETRRLLVRLSRAGDMQAANERLANGRLLGGATAGDD